MGRISGVSTQENIHAKCLVSTENVDISSISPKHEVGQGQLLQVPQLGPAFRVCFPPQKTTPVSCDKVLLNPASVLLYFCILKPYSALALALNSPK